jgi:hypothetical protein
MSSAPRQNFEIEESADMSPAQMNPKPFVVAAGRVLSADRVTRRVSEALDLALANGSMPA